MVSDAEVHADDDRKLHELVDARNQCDAMVHSVRKSLAEYGDKLDGGDKLAIETAMKEAEEAIKANDKAAIESKTQALAMASQKLGEKVYAQQQARDGGAGTAESSGSGGSSGAKKDEGDVVDAEFTEVKDRK